MDDVISSRSDHFSVLSPTSDFCSSWAPIVAASPLLLRIEEDASESIAEDQGCLAILKMMESSRAAVVTPTWNVFERWLKHVGISYLPYRACAILGIPRRSEGGSSMFRHYTWILSFQVQQE
jgi:hypothetical protein